MRRRARSPVRGAREAGTELDVRFLTPLGALLAVSALGPLVVLLARRRRLAEVARALELEQPRLTSQLPLVLALAAVPVLLGVAAAQPVIETEHIVPERTDVQAFVAIDVSRSMLASAGPRSPTRFERARELALSLRNTFPDAPFGIASLTDRVLPHLFPTTDTRVFSATLARSLGIEQPPPGAFYLTFATNLNGLRAVAEKNYFPASAKKRLLIVFTDGETQTPEPELGRAFERRPHIETMFVRLWGADERIYETGVAEGGYRPDARSGAALARAAALVGGRTFDEADADDVAGAVRAAIGEGETIARSRGSGRLPLMPYLTLAALFPLAFVLLRRNVWWGWTRRVPLRERPASAARTEHGFGSAVERV